MNFKELIVFEQKHELWEYKLLQYPLWIHCREPLMSTAIMAERKMRRPSLGEMFKSFWQTMKFLLSQKKYDKVFFLMERAELLEVYYQEKNPRKILFLNPEQERAYKGEDAISSDFFSFLRFLSRKTAYLLFYYKYKRIIKSLEMVDIEKYIQDAFGDALFLKFLSIILSKKNQKIYTGAVIPIGEKFINALNSYEVQHGVIYPTHIGYIGIPKVKNTLILYSQRYENILYKEEYLGRIEVNNYKKNFFEKLSYRHFSIVIYSQPLLEMQEKINDFFKRYQPKDVFIQRHPKDYFSYNIEPKKFVTATTPFEVKYPIMYLSSVMENFTNYDKNCYLIDLKSMDIDSNDFIDIYTQGSKSKIFIKSSFEEIYEELKCQK